MRRRGEGEERKDKKREGKGNTVGRNTKRVRDEDIHGEYEEREKTIDQI